jgi:hypothetical protein
MYRYVLNCLGRGEGSAVEFAASLSACSIVLLILLLISRPIIMVLLLFSRPVIIATSLFA